MHIHKYTPSGIWKRTRQEIGWETKITRGGGGGEVGRGWSNGGKKKEKRRTERENQVCRWWNSCCQTLRKQRDVLNKTSLSSLPLLLCLLPSGLSLSLPLLPRLLSCSLSPPHSPILSPPYLSLSPLSPHKKQSYCSWNASLSIWRGVCGSTI